MLRPQDLDKLPDSLVELYSQAEQSILADMAARIAAFDDFIPAAQWQYRKLIEMGSSRDYVVKTLAALMGKTEAEVKRIMKQYGDGALTSDDKIYRAAGLSPRLLSSSPRLQEILSAGLESTMGLFENLTRTTANTATQQLERALDRAWLQVSSGAFSHQEATRMAVKELAAAGIESIRYPSGHVDKLDVVVRRALLTGVNQTALKLQEARAEEMGCDLVEVTAHAGARVGIGVADHAGWQGKVYSRSGNHAKYPSLVKKTGYGTGPGLGGWNCRHSMFPFVEGVSEPTYTHRELDALNAPMYEYNGHKMTEYEATQRQRYIERQIRRWKREKAAMKAAGLDTAESAAKLKKWQNTQRDFLQQTGLKRQYDRERVKPVGAAAAANDSGSGAVPVKKTATFRTAIPGYPDAVNDSISRAGKHTVEEGAKRQGEHLVLVDTRTGQWVFEEAGDEVSVGSSEVFRRFVDEHPDGRFSYVHSHPSGEGFSLNDMVEFFGADQFESMVAAGYNGKVYAVYGKRRQVNAWGTLMSPEVDTALTGDLRQRLRDGTIDSSYFKREVERRRVQYLKDHFCSEWEAGT